MNDTTAAITGIHHITAIASDPQQNIDFYAGLLGLRQVKKTVNFDDPSAYHLYYGDEQGTPGSIVTFFYWPGHDARGRVGSGQTTALVFSAPPTSLEWWQQRLERHDVKVERKSRFGEEVLSFADPDAIPVEIVAVAEDNRNPWTGAGIPAEHALRGLHSAELTVAHAAHTEALLSNEMQFRLVKREGNRARFEAGSGGSGRYADVIEDSTGKRGSGGSGTIHHIAWSVPDDATELAKQTELQDSGYQVSPVMDRDYFHSIYYRERGGILFEIATATPGFAVDEPAESLGAALKLPKQFEAHRARIEELLPPVQPAKSFT
ncbi:ring-cleaving dioxygenase [Haloferula sp. BvORR071]|uniref:ring-cleaving dioxygenase n=1 Tax=Haloferula sp. BvORR071 TaxID=1396141 RepID=UPI000554B43C|nr:ring-cleaving dioxygenase [Haloferula sp. BvORR071]